MQSKFLMRAVLSILFAIQFPLPTHAGPAEDAQAAFSKFFPAFVAHNETALAAMFAPDAQFYGTSSPELVTTPEGVLKYFTAALDCPVIWQATSLKMTSTALSDSLVLVAGMWNVNRTQDGKTTSSGPPLRVTAVLQKRNNHWLIVQFHKDRSCL